MEILYSKGAKRTVLYYLVCVVLTVAVHWTFAGERGTLLPKSCVILISGMMGALPWMILNLLGINSRKNASLHKGDLIVHCAMFLIVAFILSIRSFT